MKHLIITVCALATFNQPVEIDPLNLEPRMLIQSPVVAIEEIQEEIPIEYPNADYIWNYLKELKYNDYVCAGILGNIMVEVGGNTLEIDETLENNYYYGICQWSKYYYPEAINLSLEEQCEYLKETIEYELNIFGNIYKKEFGYEEFLNIDNSRDAALAFAKVYERCYKGSYYARQNCAEAAYDYFVNGIKQE